MTPEQALWAAVITQAVCDLKGNRTSPYAANEKLESYHWFKDSGASFNHVCQLSGLSSGYVQRLVKPLLKANKHFAEAYLEKQQSYTKAIVAAKTEKDALVQNDKRRKKLVLEIKALTDSLNKCHNDIPKAQCVVISFSDFFKTKT